MVNRHLHIGGRMTGAERARRARALRVAALERSTAEAAERLAAVDFDLRPTRAGGVARVLGWGDSETYRAASTVPGANRRERRKAARQIVAEHEARRAAARAEVDRLRGMLGQVKPPAFDVPRLVVNGCEFTRVTAPTAEEIAAALNSSLASALGLWSAEDGMVRITFARVV